MLKHAHIYQMFNMFQITIRFMFKSFDWPIGIENLKNHINKCETQQFWKQKYQ